jgi:hypothetical protein
VPLSTALALLADRRGVTRLEVPVRGPLHDPGFRVSRQFASALAGTARAALNVAFEPIGLSTAAGARAPGASPALGLDPIPFPEGAVTPGAEALARLDALAGRLAEHPRVRVRLCGRSVPADLPESMAAAPAGISLRLTALALALARAEFVADYLASEHAIPAGQLVDCAPRAEASGGASPGVLVLLAPRPAPLPASPRAGDGSGG